MTRRVVVVGGTSGIGRAAAAAFARDGCDVIATGHAAEADVDGIRFAVLDVRDDAAVGAFFAPLQRIDVLVNAAGIITRNGGEFTSEGFAATLDVNLIGTHRCCLAAYPALKAVGGCVVNMASMLTFFGSAVSPGYAASKGGIGQLTRSLAMAWAGDGIRVNAVAPGWIETPLTTGLDAARSAAIVARTPMARWGRPDDVAGPIRFLASPDAAFVTGAILPVDGGYSAA